MGNIKSCLYTKSNTARIVALHSNTIQLVNVPTTAAEIMLEEPGYVISPLTAIRLNKRFGAMKAEEMLAGGRVYLLIPINRVNKKVSEPEMVVIDSACCEGRSKQRSSKVQPVANETNGNDIVDDSAVKNLGEGDHSRGIFSCRMRQWTPVLESILEDKTF